MVRRDREEASQPEWSGRARRRRRHRHAGWTVGLDDTLEWIDRYSGQNTLLFVDAPLLVDNATGQRDAERQVGQRYGRSWVSANSTNLASPRQAGVRLRERLERDGWRYDDGRAGPPTSGRVVSECYPYSRPIRHRRRLRGPTRSLGSQEPGRVDP